MSAELGCPSCAIWRDWDSKYGHLGPPLKFLIPGGRGTPLPLQTRRPALRWIPLAGPDSTTLHGGRDRVVGTLQVHPANSIAGVHTSRGGSQLSHNATRPDAPGGHVKSTIPGGPGGGSLVMKRRPFTGFLISHFAFFSLSCANSMAHHGFQNIQIKRSMTPIVPIDLTEI